MPGEIIDRPNPPPVPSNLPDSIEQLQVKLQKTTLEQPACDALYKFRRAAAYIAAGREIARHYDNPQMADKLDSNDISAGQCAVETRLEA